MQEENLEREVGRNTRDESLGNAGCTGQLEWCLTRPRFEFIKNLGAQTHQGSEGTLCKIFLNKDKIIFKIQMLINFPKCAKLALMTTVSANLKSCPLVYPSVRLTGVSLLIALKLSS